MATADPEDDAQNHSSKPFMAASPLLKISHQETQPAITRENPEETCKNSWKKKNQTGNWILWTGNPSMLFSRKV